MNIDMNKSRRAMIKDVRIGARFGCMSDDYGVICIGQIVRIMDITEGQVDISIEYMNDHNGRLTEYYLSVRDDGDDYAAVVVDDGVTIDSTIRILREFVRRNGCRKECEDCPLNHSLECLTF